MFKIIGADQQQYGPVSADQIRQWIAEGRANAQTVASPEGSTEWKPLASFPEFAEALSRQAPPPPTAGAPPVSATVAPGTYQPQPHVPNYLVQAILVTLCCCLPFGIVAIVYAAQVNSKLSGGDLAGATAASRNAKLWCWISFAVGLLFTVVYLAFIATTGAWNFHRQF
jgi:hypothetical protein